jgi:type VI secretion system protein ImpK
MGHAKDTPGNPLEDDPDDSGPGRRNRRDVIRAGLNRLAIAAGWRRPEPPPPPVEARINPILRTATPLLALMLRLPELPPPANLEGLRHRIIAALRRFPSTARAAGMAPDPMRAAHFILCTAFDDIIGATPWGQQGHWSDRSLTQTFHKSLDPGPSLVILLDHLRAEPRQHLDELELVSVCFALGFDGHTGTLPNGTVAFQRLREDISRTVATERGLSVAGLSPSWQGLPAPRPPAGAGLPVWVTVSLAGALLTGLYVLFAFSLGRDTDHAYQRLAALLPDRPAVIAHLESPPSPGPALTAPEPAVAPAPEASAPMAASARAKRFQEALARESAAEEVEVLTTAAGDVIRIAATPAFNRTGDTLSRPGHDLAERLAVLLDREPGRILVLGYTDDGFVPSLRFASSVALTEARARAFARVLVAHLQLPDRVDIEGRADTEPLLPNTSPANREHNRRIEILLAPTNTTSP